MKIFRTIRAFDLIKQHEKRQVIRARFCTTSLLRHDVNKSLIGPLAGTFNIWNFQNNQSIKACYSKVMQLIN